MHSWFMRQCKILLINKMPTSFCLDKGKGGDIISQQTYHGLVQSPSDIHRVVSA